MKRYFKSYQVEMAEPRYRWIVVFEGDGELGRSYYSDGVQGLMWSIEDMGMGEFTEITLPQAMLIWPGVIHLP